MDSVTQWLLIVCVLVWALYRYGTRNHGYWARKGVKQLSPVPFLGDNVFGFAKKQNPLDIVAGLYNPFKHGRFGGVYVGQKAFLSVTDPQLLKQIMVKDSDFFLNRHDWFQSSDPIMSKNLVNLRDDSWRKMRAVMTTVFTSAKMKDMFGFMEKCARQAVEFLEEEARGRAGAGRGAHEIECKEFFSRYGTDVIATTAFGFEVDSLRDPENEFYRSGYVIRNLLRGFGWVKFFLMLSFPGVCQRLGMTFFGKRYNEFFTSLVEETIRHREENNIVRKDVIHILMEARKGKRVDDDGDLVKGKLPDLQIGDIAAQALLFFFGGFETIAALLGFITYELAVNPDVQEKLQREIDEVLCKEDGVTYDGVIYQMQYLDMVVNETLRKWPPAAMTDRDVTKTYVIPQTPVSPEVVLTKGDRVLVPIAALHYDPDYFPDPERFDPERFSNDRNAVKPFTYLPFGEGLRHCIGKRYALMEAKTILVHLLTKFTLSPAAKTDIPMQLAKTGAFSLAPANGFWLQLHPRQ